MKYNFTSRFYLKPEKKNSKGLNPIYFRMTLNGQRIELATNKSILTDDWNKYSQRGRGTREEMRVLNSYLDNLQTKANKIFNKLVEDDEYFDVNTLKNTLIGKGKSDKTLIQVYEENNQLMKQESGIKYSNVTVNRYDTSLERLKEFLLKEYKQQDIVLVKLDYQFIKRYEIFLRTKYSCQHNTVMNYLKQLKKVVHQAIHFGYLDKDPFTGYKTSYQEVNRDYLSFLRSVTSMEKGV